MAENKVAVEITLEEKAALKALTQLTKEVQKTETGFKKMGEQGDESLGVLGELAKGTSDGFGSLVKGVTVANLATEAIIGTANAVKNFVLDSVNAAVEQENAINRLSQALRASGDNSKSSLDDLTAFASGLQQVSRYGDEVVIGQLALAKSFGATNGQAKGLVEAAANLAATFGGSLEQRVQELGKALNGNVGRLGQLIPELKNFTKAQLDAGAATDLINSKFGGAAANELQTYEGRVTSMKNAISDFQEELGGLFTNSETVGNATSFLTGIFQRLTEQMAASRVEAEALKNGYVDSAPEVEVLVEKYAQVNAQLEKYQAISTSSGLDLRTLNDAKEQVTVLTAELERLNQAISISSASVARDQARPQETATNNGSAGLSPEDQKLVESRKQAYADMIASRAEFDAYEAEQELLKTQVTEENYLAELDRLIAFEQEKVNAKFLAEEQKIAAIQDAKTREFQTEKLANDKLIALDKAKLDAQKKVDQQRIALDQTTAAARNAILGSSFQLAAALAKDGSKEQFLIQKAAALAEIAIARGKAMALIPAQTAHIPFPGNIPAAATLTAYANAQAAIGAATVIAQAIKGYENGGIVPGTSFSGDNVVARVNSGEMILNRQQQSNLFNLANSGGAGISDDQIGRIITALTSQPINIVVDGRVLASVIRSQVQAGFKFA
jgi:hypothetical protein